MVLLLLLPEADDAANEEAELRFRSVGCEEGASSACAESRKLCWEAGLLNDGRLRALEDTVDEAALVGSFSLALLELVDWAG